MQMVGGFIVGYLVIAFVLIPLFYRMGVVSLYEYLDRRFGMGAHPQRRMVLLHIQDAGSVDQGLRHLRRFADADIRPLPYTVRGQCRRDDVAGMALHTRRGGVQSVIWTDLLKTACLIGSVVLCIVFMTRELGLGAAETAVQVADHDFSRIFFFDDPTDRRYFFKQFFAGIFMVVAMTGLDQDMMQRTLSCRNYRDSQKNMIISILLQTG